jgi:hypothetical protein
MNRWILVLAAVAAGALALPRPAQAVAPELMSYQGVLLQNDGIAVPDGVYDLRFRLFDQQSGGTPVFEQTLSTQVVHGLYNVILSSNGGYDLASVVTQNAQLFIEVTVLANPPIVPSDVTLLPRQQLASVPYALTETPGLVSAKILRNSTSTTLTADDWTVAPGLQGLTLDIPSGGCVIEVQARVVVSCSGGCTSVKVGARIEQSVDGGAYTVVSGHSIASAASGEGATASLEHVLENPVAGSYVYRVQVREDTTSDYVINPTIGALQGESTLSGKLWCP